MTAKEMLKDHKHLSRGYYVFEPEELKKFLSQYSKEQREICVENFFNKVEKNKHKSKQGEGK